MDTFEATDARSTMLQVWRKGSGVELLVSTYGDHPETISMTLTDDQRAALIKWLLDE